MVLTRWSCKVRLTPGRKLLPLPSAMVMAGPYTATQILPKLKETAVVWPCESYRFLNVGHSSILLAHRMLASIVRGTSGSVRNAWGCYWPSLSSRVDSRFRPYGAGIINEVLLAIHPQASTIPIVWTSAPSLSCNLRPFTQPHQLQALPPLAHCL